MQLKENIFYETSASPASWPNNYVIIYNEIICTDFKKKNYSNLMGCKTFLNFFFSCLADVTLAIRNSFKAAGAAE